MSGFNDMIYSAGSSLNSIDFNNQLISSQQQCGLIYSTYTSGEPAWSKALLCYKGAHVLDIGTLSNGNLIALVTYHNKLQVEDQQLISNNTDTLWSDNHALVCLNSQGQLQWMKNTTGASPYWGKLAITPSDEIILSGFCADVENFFSTDPISTLDSTQVWTPWGQAVWTYRHDYFGYIAKLSQDGTPLWVKASDGFVNDITVRPNGSVLIAGYLNGTSNIQENIIQPFGTETGYIAQFDSNGDFNWIKRFGGSANDNRLRGVTLDPDGNIYATGSILGNNVQIEGYDSFLWSECNAILIKLDANGNVLWYRVMGVDGWNNDEPNFNSGMNLRYGNNGIFLTGYFSNFISNGGFNLYRDGAPDLFLMHFDDQGICNYAKNYVTYGWNMGADLLYVNDDLYLCGYSYGENWSSAEPSYCLLGKIGSSELVLSNNEEKDNTNGFRVFPNPCNDQLQITNSATTNSEYHIFDSTGQLIRIEKTRGNTFISTEDFPSGIFYLTDISTGFTMKILKR